MKFILILGLTFLCGMTGLQVVRSLDWPYWGYHAFVLGTGALLYLLNNFLIVRYIATRAPEFASKEEALPGVQKWELTAGSGVVPKWVSLIGLISIGFLLASPFELLALLARKLGL